MDKQEKVWGRTSCLFLSDFVSVHHLQVLAGGFCSEHYHSRKKNVFHVIRGRLRVFQWRGASTEAEPDVTVLGAGDSMVIPVGVWHKFQADEPTECLEIYEAAPVEEDILRRKAGGLDEPAKGLVQ